MLTGVGQGTGPKRGENGDSILNLSEWGCKLNLGYRAQGIEMQNRQFVP